MVSKAGKTGDGRGFQGRKNRKGEWFPRQEKQEMAWEESERELDRESPDKQESERKLFRKSRPAGDQQRPAAVFGKSWLGEA